MHLDVSVPSFDHYASTELKPKIVLFKHPLGLVDRFGAFKTVRPLTQAVLTYPFVPITSRYSPLTNVVPSER